MAGVLIGERWARTGRPCGAHGVGPRGVARGGAFAHPVYPYPWRAIARPRAAFPGAARCTGRTKRKGGTMPALPIRIRLAARYLWLAHGARPSASDQICELGAFRLGIRDSLGNRHTLVF